MKSKKMYVLAAIIFSFGVLVGSVFPNYGKAASNVVLASVEWVTSQLNPINKKIADLENLLASQQSEIRAIREALENGNIDVGAKPSIVYVNQPAATIHSGALRSYRIVASKPIATALPVERENKSSDGLWYRVKVSNSLYGWIKASDVSLTKVAQPTQVKITQTTKLYKGALTSYPVVTTLSSGSTYHYETAFKNDAGEIWYKIQISSKKSGWVQGKYSEVN